VIATNIGADSLRRIGWISGQIGQADVLNPPNSRPGARCRGSRYVLPGSGESYPRLVDDLGRGSFDLIGSNAVIEEIYDPESNFRARERLLRPGGWIHKIYLRDHGMFAKYGFFALEFLSVP